MESVTLEMVYKKLQFIEDELKELSEGLHIVKPEFMDRLKQTEKGKFHTFKNIQEMERHMDKIE